MFKQSLIFDLEWKTSLRTEHSQQTMHVVITPYLFSTFTLLIMGFFPISI